MNTAQLKSVGEILLKAAYSDGACQGVEVEEIRKILISHNGGSLPEEVLTHLAKYDVRTFELSKIVGGLETHEPTFRRALLILVARITNADGALTLDEDSFLRRVAYTIGAGPEELDGIAVDFESLYTQNEDDA